MKRKHFNNIYTLGQVCFFVLSISIASLLASSCGSEGSVSNQETENQFNKTDSLSEIAGINIFLENSASMAGYFRERTDFSDMMDNLLTKLKSSSGFPDKVKTYTICDTIDWYENISDFQSALRLEPGHSISIGQSSKLDQILEMVYQNTQKGEVSLLITDAIMSGSDHQLRKYFSKNHKHYNQEQKVALKNEIFSTVDRYKKVRFVGVFADYSSFKGVYYKLDNSILKGKFSKRPYYLIAVGDKNVFINFTKFWSKNTEFEEQSLFGLPNNMLSLKPTRYSTLSESNSTITKNDKIKLTKNRKKFKIPLMGKFDLILENGMSIQELEQGFELLINEEPMENTSFEIYRLDDENAPISSKNNPELLEQRKEHSHMLVLDIKDYLHSSTDDLKIALKKKPSNYWQDWSSDDDFNIDVSYSKTLNLKYFLQGFEEAYNDEYIFYYKLNIN